MRIISVSPCKHFDCSNRNSFGYCKTTVCINEHYQQEQWGSPSTTNKPESVVKKPQTNADRIRAMSDEEMAEWMVAEQINGIYAFLEGLEDDDLLHDFIKVINLHGAEEIKKEKLEWLKQEVSDA